MYRHLFRPLKSSLTNQVLEKASASSSAIYNEFYTKSIAHYKENSTKIDLDLNDVIYKHKTVLFLYGDVDTPQCYKSLQAIKILTDIQALPLMTINVLAHPGIAGYSLSRIGDLQQSSTDFPHLYVDGRFYGNIERIVNGYKNGELAKTIGLRNGVLDAATRQEIKTAEEVPIAMY